MYMGVYRNGDYHERKIAAVYVGKIWKWQVQSIFDGKCHGVVDSFADYQRPLLYAGSGCDDICLFQDVFQKYSKAFRRKSVVSAKRTEGKGLFPEKEAGASVQKAVSYL